MSRPDRLEGYGLAIEGELRESLDESAAGLETRDGILTVAGRVFSARADVYVTLASLTEAQRIEGYQPFGRNLSPPIAAVNGLAIGVGMDRPPTATSASLPHRPILDCSK